MSTKTMRSIKETSSSLLLLSLAVVVGGYLYTVFPMIQSAVFDLSIEPSSAPSNSVYMNPEKQHKHDSTKPWVYDFSQLPDGPLGSDDWNFEEGTTVANYNNEEQMYTSRPQNVRVENGALVIEARVEQLGDKQYSSARIDTKGIFDFTYGTLEVEMMLPRGVGTWPAAWLMPSENKYNPDDYDISSGAKFSWAMNGEIDFMEAIGSVPDQNLPAAHSFNSFYREPILTPGHINDAYGSYHRYGVIKKTNEIIFTIDGMPFATRTKTSDNPKEWPFDQPYYLILNLAIGGNWEGVNGVDTSNSPWQLKLKSISYQPLT